MSDAILLRVQPLSLYALDSHYPLIGLKNKTYIKCIAKKFHEITRLKIDPNLPKILVCLCGQNFATIP